jgi:hypothetical protein
LPSLADRVAQLETLTSQMQEEVKELRERVSQATQVEAIIKRAKES